MGIAIPFGDRVFYWADGRSFGGVIDVSLRDGWSFDPYTVVDSKGFESLEAAKNAVAGAYMVTAKMRRGAYDDR